MKKLFKYLLISACSISLANCENIKTSNPTEESSNLSEIENKSESSIVSEIESQSEELSSIEEVSSTQEIAEEKNLLAEDYSLLEDLSTKESNLPYNWLEEYATDDIASEDEVNFEEVYVNNKIQSNDHIVQISSKDDVKEVFYNKQSHARFVNKADGYCLTMPTTTTLATDFSLGKYRSKLYNETSTLTVSYEHSNPYSKWETYRNEWLFRYLDAESYYLQNNLEATRAPKLSDNSVLSGYTVDEYDIVINNPLRIEKNYYNIAAIRPTGVVKKFYLLVMKSNEEQNEKFDYIINSFKVIDQEGSPNNSSYNDLEISYNPNWNEETKNYYDLLLTQQRTDWGAFVATLPSGRLTKSQINANNCTTKKNALEEALDYTFDLIPTYQHIGYGNSLNYDFPSSAASALAGGNGFNGLPVLQMSYQFTTNNNNVSVGQDSNCYTPMFDIYRGADDDIITDKNTKIDYMFRNYAQQVKAYGKPVLFRLNNEMNTDWTSYCGMMTLLDPDIFQATWRILYDIFEEEGVDNCIWIFNPIAKSCPYSSWGEDMCYYPGIDYVQALGLTYYEMNNNNEVNENTFKNDYSELYNKNYPVWKKYPWIISEFGCGAGGETTGARYRNQQSQVNYVKGMLNDFNNRENNPYLQNIKGAVWFSCNDYTNDNKVVNQLELEIDKLPLTIAALKAGLAKNKR